MKKLEEIRARAEQATLGPWRTGGDSEEYRSAYVETTWAVDGEHTELVTDYLKPADAEFIAHSRTDVPKLVTALEAVEALVTSTPQVSGLGGPHTLVPAEAIIQAIQEALQ